MMKKEYRLIVCSASAFLAVALSVNASTVIFSNNFDDGDIAPEIGTWNFTAATNTSAVSTTLASPNGAFVGLFDQSGSGNLDATINLTDTALLTGGNTVTIAFDIANRRTNGNSKTIFMDALDSNGDIVTRLVLGDSNAFGNGGNDRQRPGYDVDSTGAANTGNTIFSLTTGTATGADPAAGNFWGADNTPATFGFASSVVADAQLTLTIEASTFGFSGDKAFTGPNYTTTGIANYDGNTFADVASIKLSSAGANYGFYLDNFEVTASAIAAVPEPSSLALVSLAAFGFCGVRRRR